MIVNLRRIFNMGLTINRLTAAGTFPFAGEALSARRIAARKFFRRLDFYRR